MEMGKVAAGEIARTTWVSRSHARILLARVKDRLLLLRQKEQTVEAAVLQHGACP